MHSETMSVEERVWTALKLGKPDRVPISPVLSNHGSANLTGASRKEVFNNPYAALDAMLKVFDEFGGWDKVEYPYPLMPIRYSLGVGMKVKIPGIDLPDDYIAQPIEQEILKLDDYETIRDLGWDKFVRTDLIFRITDLTAEGLEDVEANFTALKKLADEEWRKRGVVTTCEVDGHHPFFKLCLSRSLIRFTEDLFSKPDLVEVTIKTMTEETIEALIRGARETGTKVVGLTEERASAYFYPPRIFEKFWWPYTKNIINSLWSEGIVTIFHLDSCWDKNLKYFLELPRGSSVLSLDGTTDIFKAKEILKNHLCIQGDVHPSLLSLASTDDMVDYVKRLINFVGLDGGFILGVGCELPSSCKAENFRAFLETAKNYELKG